MKTFFIVGHRSGIGRALTELLLERGDEVVGLSRQPSDLTHPKLRELQADVMDWDGTGLPERLDGLVYAPGSINLKPFKGYKPEEFRSDFELNALGAALCLQKAEKSLRAGQGSALLFSTVAVNQGMSYHASIAMAKGAVEGLVRSLAAEWAPAVRVNALAPSLTNTPLASKLLGNEARAAAAAERHPLKRVGEASELAAAGLALLDNAWISGQVLGVDGGMSSLRP
ncbi:MAG: SDR family NAD(P)-dependent oxidoreductase [Schleiferiaceae bacterium]